MIVAMTKGDLIQVGIFQCTYCLLIRSSFTQFSCVAVHFEIKDPITIVCFYDWNGSVMYESCYPAVEQIAITMVLIPEND